MARFKVGDTVTIRQWNDMEEAFGLFSHGYISTYRFFTSRMIEFCGTEHVITSVNGLEIALSDGKGHSFSKDMFEPRHAIQIKEGKTNKDITNIKNIGDCVVYKEGLLYKYLGKEEFDKIYYLKD